MNETLKTALRHIGLFIATFITVTFAGAFTYSTSAAPEYAFSWEVFRTGLPFSIPFLSILMVHEFGHYFVARWRKVKTSLPYFIPFIPLFLGTFGAVIVMKGKRNTRKDFFDIGIAGPLAGWVVAMGVLWFGYATLPPPDTIFDIHPEYEAFGLDYPEHVYGATNDSTTSLYFGTNLTMQFFETVVASPDRVPPRQEIMHFPIIMAGFWGLFFTALNLLPIGQLDGGHVLYGLVGSRRQRPVSAVIFLLLLTVAGIGIVSPNEPFFAKGSPFSFDSLALKLPLYLGFLYFALRGLRLPPMTRLTAALAILTVQYLVIFAMPDAGAFNGYLLFAVLLSRVVGVYHPPALLDQPLDMRRQVLGWFALFIFIISFIPIPIQIL